jgi:predicted  nucleic acid-binding Zn-ribbon protein
VSVIDKLLVVQDFDSRIREIRKQLRDIPVRKDEERSRLHEHELAVKTAEERLKNRQVELKKTELEIEVRRERIAKLRQQQLGLKTNKEFQAMDTEIKGVEGEISKIEDQQILVMVEIDQEKGTIKALQQAVKVEETAVLADVKILDERAAKIGAEVAGLQAQREAVAKDVDRQWLARYEQIFERKDRALVSVEDGICGGCHMKLPPYVTHDAKKKTVMVTCGFCGRLVH